MNLAKRIYSSWDYIYHEVQKRWVLYEMQRCESQAGRANCGKKSKKNQENNENNIKTIKIYVLDNGHERLNGTVSHRKTHWMCIHSVDVGRGRSYHSPRRTIHRKKCHPMDFWKNVLEADFFEEWRAILLHDTKNAAKWEFDPMTEQSTTPS